MCCRLYPGGFYSDLVDRASVKCGDPAGSAYGDADMASEESVTLTSRRNVRMTYYHLVTRIPMTKGQIIDFSGENKNRSYDFWMKHFWAEGSGWNAFWRIINKIYVIRQKINNMQSFLV